MGDSDEEEDYYVDNQTSNSDSKYTYGNSHGGEGGDDDDEDGDVDAVEEPEPLAFDNDIAVLKARWVTEKEEVRESDTYADRHIDRHICMHIQTHTSTQKHRHTCTHAYMHFIQSVLSDLSLFYFPQRVLPMLKRQNYPYGCCPYYVSCIRESALYKMKRNYDIKYHNGAYEK